MSHNNPQKHIFGHYLHIVTCNVYNVFVFLNTKIKNKILGGIEMT